MAAGKSRTGILCSNVKQCPKGYSQDYADNKMLKSIEEV